MSRFGDLRLQSERVRGCMVVVGMDSENKDVLAYFEICFAWERRMQSLSVERGLRSLNGFHSQGRNAI